MIFVLNQGHGRTNFESLVATFIHPCLVHEICIFAVYLIFREFCKIGNSILSIRCINSHCTTRVSSAILHEHDSVIEDILKPKLKTAAFVSNRENETHKTSFPVGSCNHRDLLWTGQYELNIVT